MVGPCQHRRAGGVTRNRTCGTARASDGEPVRLPPTPLVEPDWADRFPGTDPDEARLRERCHNLWTRIGPSLARSVGLVAEQQETFVEWITNTARIEQIERRMSLEGLITEGQRGPVRNPLSTLANQYRSHRKGLTAELGLSPAAAARLVRPLDDEDDPSD